MYRVQVNRTSVFVSGGQVLTSGSANIYRCTYDFSSDWSDFQKVAVFRAGARSAAVLLDSSNTCVIPHEVLVEPGLALQTGVYGTKDEIIVMPTIWGTLGIIKQGVSPVELSKPPTPNVVDQIIHQAASAYEIALSVRQDADQGKFDGKPGPQGPEGPPGSGARLPSGGTAGQVLAKASDMEEDFVWKDPITYAEVSNDSGGKTVIIGGI